MKSFKKMQKFLTYNDYYEYIYSITKSIIVSRETISFICGKNNNIFTEITDKDRQKIENIIKELKNNKPIQYIIGEWDFYGLTFKINENVLIPRADTEKLVDLALNEHGNNILDLCSGSGCIGISILKNKPEAFCTFIDISEAAMEIAVANAKIHSVENRCEFIIGDVICGMRLSGEYDIILSNPPYIKACDIKRLDKSVKDYEPRLALDSGESNFTFYNAIINNFEKYLKITGVFIFEAPSNVTEERLNSTRRTVVVDIGTLK